MACKKTPPPQPSLQTIIGQSTCYKNRTINVLLTISAGSIENFFQEVYFNNLPHRCGIRRYRVTFRMIVLHSLLGLSLFGHNLFRHTVVRVQQPLSKYVVYPFLRNKKSNWMGLFFSASLQGQFLLWIA